MIKSFLLCIFFFSSLQAYAPTKQQIIQSREALTSPPSVKCMTIPEGGFVYFFNESLTPFLAAPLNQETLSELKRKLNPHLKIPFSREGFTMTSTRRSEDELDETNYSAIWVRDSCWHYFSLAINDQTKAKTLLMSLLKFYSSPEQKKRFINVILNPEIADPEINPNAAMSVPLIRFSRQTFCHHQVDGKDQVWNHLQFDSHGLFLTALSNAFKNQILSPQDLTADAIEVLSLFPAFFMSTEYWQRGDSGPWEEILMNNASTIGLIAAGLRNFNEMLGQNPSLHEHLLSAAYKMKDGKLIASQLMPDALDYLYEKGIEQVEFNLKLGGEAPDVRGSGNHRGADVALLFLCFPDGALFYESEEMIQNVLNITSGLIGPFGIFRYKLDAYQALNYWINYDVPSPINGKKTAEFEFLTRFQKGYMPADQAHDAQWFFDSTFAGIYYHLCELTQDVTTRSFYLRRGDFHLKRALGQFTSEAAVAANGEKIPAMGLPESINTVLTEQHVYHPMPSPICPLTWAVASMNIALDKAFKAHQQE